MDECSICCEKLNKSNRNKIDCKTCTDENIKVCRSCAKRYILEQPTDASCMVCKIEWDTEFLSNNFTKAFVNKELKNHRENYLIEKQISMLPETQEYAEKLKEIENLEKQKDIINLRKKKLENEIKKLNINLQEISTTVFEIKSMLNNKNKEKSKLKYKCPVDDCKGFLNEKYECGICDNKICKNCMEILDEGHVCDSEKKETIKLLNQDSKPCPKCGELIFKLPNGCDQMYCIMCHTAFSWRTGELERGHIHNPEYYRWMRENGKEIPRNPLDVREGCEDILIDFNLLLVKLRIYFKVSHGGRNNTQIIDKSETIKIVNMYRMVMHINHLNRNHEYDNRNHEQTLKNMRANFILNRLTKEEFKKKLQILEKKKNKEKKMNDIWNLIRLVIIENIKIISDKNYSEKEGKRIINKIIEDSEKVREYSNNLFENVGKVYNVVYPGINSEWIQISNMKEYNKMGKK